MCQLFLRVIQSLRWCFKPWTPILLWLTKHHTNNSWNHFTQCKSNQPSYLKFWIACWNDCWVRISNQRTVLFQNQRTLVSSSAEFLPHNDLIEECSDSLHGDLELLAIASSVQDVVPSFSEQIMLSLVCETQLMVEAVQLTYYLSADLINIHDATTWFMTHEGCEIIWW